MPIGWKLKLLAAEVDVMEKGVQVAKDHFPDAVEKAEARLKTIKAIHMDYRLKVHSGGGKALG